MMSQQQQQYHDQEHESDSDSIENNDAPTPTTSKAYGLLDGYPSVKKLFIRFNTSLNSSGAIERIFNYAGIQNEFRTFLLEH